MPTLAEKFSLWTARVSEACTFQSTLYAESLFNQVGRVLYLQQRIQTVENLLRNITVATGDVAQHRNVKTLYEHHFENGGPLGKDMIRHMVFYSLHPNHERGQKLSKDELAKITDKDVERWFENQEGNYERLRRINVVSVQQQLEATQQEFSLMSQQMGEELSRLAEGFKKASATEKSRAWAWLVDLEGQLAERREKEGKTHRPIFNALKVEDGKEGPADVDQLLAVMKSNLEKLQERHATLSESVANQQALFTDVQEKLDAEDQAALVHAKRLRELSLVVRQEISPTVENLRQHTKSLQQFYGIGRDNVRQQEVKVGDSEFVELVTEASVDFSRVEDNVSAVPSAAADDGHQEPSGHPSSPAAAALSTDTKPKVLNFDDEQTKADITLLADAEPEFVQQVGRVCNITLIILDMFKELQALREAGGSESLMQFTAYLQTNAPLMRATLEEIRDEADRLAEEFEKMTEEAARHRGVKGDQIEMVHLHTERHRWLISIREDACALWHWLGELLLWCWSKAGELVDAVGQTKAGQAIGDGIAAVGDSETMQTISGAMKEAKEKVVDEASDLATSFSESKAVKAVADVVKEASVKVKDAAETAELSNPDLPFLRAAACTALGCKLISKQFAEDYRRQLILQRETVKGLIEKSDEHLKPKVEETQQAEKVSAEAAQQAKAARNAVIRRIKRCG